MPRKPKVYKRKMPLYLEPLLRKKLKYIAYRTDQTANSINTAALESYLAKMLDKYPGFEVNK